MLAQVSARLSNSSPGHIREHCTDTQRGDFLADASSEKQDQILANQAAIIANQAKLDEILANQVAIKSNQSKLDQILANQEKILGKLG